MKIGIYFDTTHFSYGGPTAVLMNLLRGLKKLGYEKDICLNKPGDVNVALSQKTSLSEYPANTWFGPFVLSDFLIEEWKCPVEEIPIYRERRQFILSSEWWREYIGSFFPISPLDPSSSRICEIWESGIDTDFFKPSLVQQPKKWDFFIYFKSQDFNRINQIQTYLFSEHFGTNGVICCYYFYTAEQLRDYAQNSRFCIMVDNTESQGLAALEIMACECPIFCIDQKNYKNNWRTATSITCWDEEKCGMKVDPEEWSNAFPSFIENLQNYRPREFVLSKYTLEKSAENLLRILSSSPRIDHKTEE